MIILLQIALDDETIEYIQLFFIFFIDFKFNIKASAFPCMMNFWMFRFSVNARIMKNLINFLPTFQLNLIISAKNVF